MKIIFFLFYSFFTLFSSLSIITLITDDILIGAFQLVITSLIGAIAWFLVHLFKQIEIHSNKISDIHLKVALLENNFNLVTSPHFASLMQNPSPDTSHSQHNNNPDERN
ncbi:hypothetical protein [Ignavibacterium album]|nr:hypothetical protein [Ignavibacterium album]